MAWENYISHDLQSRYEIHDHKHAAAILANEFPVEFEEICAMLERFHFSKEDLLSAGGNESNMPKIIASYMNESWVKEKKLVAKFIAEENGNEIEVQSDTHKIDYVKGRVAFDVEWNSKDQTFDRDLFAFKTFFEFDKISVAIVLTRSEALVPLFKELGINSKYGASTTHIGKLLPRLKANRSGGCPVLVFGITPRLCVDCGE